MDNKRYSVFISSTFKDLEIERSKISRALLEIDYIPFGMEVFPAINEDRWDFIKNTVNECDYYVLIVAGRYGSLDASGISFTEKEYDYAVSQGKTILAFLHKDIETLSESKRDNKSNNQKLKKFRKKIEQSPGLVKYWETSDELALDVISSLSNAVKSAPAIGWVRADKVASEELLSEINELRKKNAELESKISMLEKKDSPAVEDIADLEEEITISGKSSSGYNRSSYPTSIKMSWKDIFYKIAPFILTTPHEGHMESVVGKELGLGIIDEQDFQTLKIQLMSLGLISCEYLSTVQGGMGWFWKLTSRGEKFLFEVRTVKTKKKEKK